MNMQTIANALKELVNKLNEYGIPLPMLRDPKSGKSSFTLTMTFLSFNNALFGQIGKLAGWLGGIDLSQANYLFLICLGAYLGRKMQSDGAKKTVTMEAEGDDNGSKN